MVITLLFSVTSVGQSKTGKIQVGFKGGQSTSFIDFKEGSFYGIDSRITFKAEEKNPSIQFGLFSRITFGSLKFFLQPELLLNMSEIKIRIEDNLFGITNSATGDHTLNKVDIIIPVGYKLGNFRIQTGPRLSILSKDKLNIFNSREQNLNNFNWGYRAGLGVDIWKFTVDVNYEYASTQIGDLIPIVDGSYGFTATRNQFMWSIGFLI